jgi:hypothetical protein
MSFNVISRTSLLLFLIVSCATSRAQLPDTDIFLIGYEQRQDSFRFDRPVNITHRKGYDNQPSFLPGGVGLLYVSIPDSGSSDIRMYMNSGKDTRYTDTPESEYSPSHTPDGHFISVVRVDRDSGQRFYRLPLEAKDASIPRPEPGTDSIGYYCWMHDSLLAMFILGKSNTLQLLDLHTHVRTLIASDIGRCMRMDPKGTTLYFVVKGNELEWKIMSLDAKSYETHELFSTLPGSEDFAVLPDGNLIMGSKGKLYRRKTDDANGWKQIGDFSITVGDFYRIAVDPVGKRLALVGFTGDKP